MVFFLDERARRPQNHQLHNKNDRSDLQTKHNRMNPYLIKAQPRERLRQLHHVNLQLAALDVLLLPVRPLFEMYK